MEVRSAAESVCRELELRKVEVSQRWAANGAISAVLVQNLVPEGANPYANPFILTRTAIWTLLLPTVCGAKRKFQF
jgi:hypothetical protein